jgi:hypothetical protein
VVSGGLGRSSNSRAWTAATAKGTGTSSRRLPMRRSAILPARASCTLQAGELVGPAGGPRVGEHAGDGLRHVLHIDRLQAGAAAADQRQDWEQPGKVGKRPQQGVARTEQGARADDGGVRKRLLNHQFAAPARADVRGSRLGICADAGDEHEASNSGRGGLSRYRLGALLVHGLERHTALLDIGRDRVYDGISSGDGCGDRGLVAHVGGEHVIWFNPAVRRALSAGSGYRTATRTFAPSAARRNASRRPRNPVPPNTVIVVMALPVAFWIRSSWPSCCRGTFRSSRTWSDQLFNSSERRLARLLLLLANFGKEGKMEKVHPSIHQDILAARVGTTRSRINFFMNKFRKLGFIEYDDSGLKVHTSLLNVIVHD